MSETKNFHETPSADETAEDAYETEPGMQARETEAEQEEQNTSEPAPEDVIEKLAKENNELKDGLLRGAAEMENLRKRTAREISDARAYAASGFARDMLGVADNLSRALSAIAPEERNADSRLKTLAEGLEMTERAMHAALERHGVRKIETVGQKFDPNFHDAIGAMEDKNVPHNTIKHEAEAGYMINGRVLRPAKVMTAQGGEKSEK